MMHLSKPASGVRRIFLIGFMGAGKSTVGRILAQRLTWQFYDIDRVIEAEQNASVATLFADRGEQVFRRLERNAIHRLHQTDRCVISLGGGAVETADVRALLCGEPDSLVIFLHAPLPVLIQRCLEQDGGAGRPVLQHDLGHQELLQARYDLRLTYYRNAHLTVETENLSLENVAAAIVKHLAAMHDVNYSPIPNRT